MNQEYVKVLLVLFLLFSLTAGVWVLQSFAQKPEPFIDAGVVERRNTFFKNQVQTFNEGGDATIDVEHAPDASSLKKAFEDLDTVTQMEKPPTENWYRSKYASALRVKDDTCMALRTANELPADEGKARLACGWMYSDDEPSFAVLATVKGPVYKSVRERFPPEQYKFVWSKNEALKLENIKRCARISKCDLVQPNSGCGFCTELGKGVPANPDGTSKYNEARCPSSALMKPEDCFKPRASAGATVIQQEPTCTPDQQGRVSRSCLSELALQASCTDKGTILQALKDATLPAMSSAEVREASDVLSIYNYSIAQGVLTDGKITMDTALNTYTNVANAAREAKPGRARKAAGNLCYGTPFDSCDYDPDSTENFKLECLQKLYNDSGCQMRGSDFPSEKNISKFKGKKWEAIRKDVNDLTTQMINAEKKFTPDEQKLAIQKCIGTRLRKRKIGFCNELGVQVLAYLGDNEKADAFIGRKILTSGFFLLRSDSSYWDSWDILSNDLTGNRNVWLKVATNLNPEKSRLLSLTRVTNIPDVVSWNDEPKIMNRGREIRQDRIDGLSVQSNEQGTQRLAITAIVNEADRKAKTVTWYVTDEAGDMISINECRLPFERKGPLINIDMSSGSMKDQSGVVSVQNNGVKLGMRGGETCGVFNGSGHLRITNPLRTRAFRSYTTRVYIEKFNPYPRIFHFFNGANVETPGPWYALWQKGSRYEVNDWYATKDNVSFQLGYNDDSIIPAYKQNSYQGNSMFQSVYGATKLNKWIHFAWIWNAEFTGYSIYMDGQQVMSVNGQSIGDPITTENEIGRTFNEPAANQFIGGIQYFRAFDYALTAEDFQQDMDNDW